MIRADLAIAEARARELTARLDAPEALGAGEVRAELAAEVEAALPFN